LIQDNYILKVSQQFTFTETFSGDFSHKAQRFIAPILIISADNINTTKPLILKFIKST